MIKLVAMVHTENVWLAEKIAKDNRLIVSRDTFNRPEHRLNEPWPPFFASGGRKNGMRNPQ
ncbi:hypothetical protein GCAAIG_04155 [Candidatus Electronema halotolerans]